MGFWDQSLQEIRPGGWGAQVFLIPFPSFWHQLMHPEARVDRLTSTKQLSDVKFVFLNSISVLIEVASGYVYFA